MKVSVITTIFNGEQYIEATLESVRQQHFQEWEYILVDDGSKDKSIEIIQNFIKIYPNLNIYLFCPGKLGRAKALNYAISKSKGKFVAIIDADDLWHQEKLTQQVGLMEKYDDVGITGTNTKQFSSNLIDTTSSLNKQPEIKNITYKQMLYVNKLPHCSVMMKRELAHYNESRTSQIDYELWLRLLGEGKKALKIDSFLSFHRVHPNQSFEAKNRVKYVINCYKLQWEYAKQSRNYELIIYLLTRSVYDLFLARLYKSIFLKKK